MTRLSSDWKRLLLIMACQHSAHTSSGCPWSPSPWMASTLWGCSPQSPESAKRTGMRTSWGVFVHLWTWYAQKYYLNIYIIFFRRTTSSGDVHRKLMQAPTSLGKHKKKEWGPPEVFEVICDTHTHTHHIQCPAACLHTARLSCTCHLISYDCRITARHQTAVLWVADPLVRLLCSKLVLRWYHWKVFLWVSDMSEADVQRPCSEMVFVCAGQFLVTAASIWALGPPFSTQTPAGCNKICFDRTVGHTE